MFSKPGKVKYGSIHLLGILLSAVYRYHPDFVVRVIDNVIESISFGLEQNDFRFLQRRIAEVKYLGELYNYRMLEHPVIFDVMYRIVTFGHGTLSEVLSIWYVTNIFQLARRYLADMSPLIRPMISSASVSSRRCSKHAASSSTEEQLARSWTTS